MKNCINLSSHNRLNEREIKDNSDLLPDFVINDLTFQGLSHNQIPVHRKEIVDTIISKFFPSTFTYSSTFSSDCLDLECRETTRTSTSSLRLREFPREIEKQLNRLCKIQTSERELYEIASLVAEWTIDAPIEYQILLAVHIQNTCTVSSRILMAVLSDIEFSTKSKILLDSASLFLKSADKRLAQTAATFLIICGGDLGKSILQKTLSSQQDLHHFTLIQGISKLLG